MLRPIYKRKKQNTGCNSLGREIVVLENSQSRYRLTGNNLALSSKFVNENYVEDNKRNESNIVRPIYKRKTTQNTACNSLRGEIEVYENSQSKDGLTKDNLVLSRRFIREKYLRKKIKGWRKKALAKDDTSLLQKKKKRTDCNSLREEGTWRMMR